jgi:dTDP-4-dehydrorhamnose reductase
VPLIHFSTDYVFNGSGDRPWREDDPTDPLSAYGVSKLAGENAVRAANGVFLIVRTSWVYAAKGTNFLRTIVLLAHERKELSIVSDQTGAPTSANVIADAIAQMITDDVGAFRYDCSQSDGVVHLGAASETSWHGFASAIVEGLKARGVKLAVEQLHPIPSEAYPTRAKRPHNSRLDLSRLRQVFGVMPAIWSDALAVELDLLAKECSDGRRLAR